MFCVPWTLLTKRGRGVLEWGKGEARVGGHGFSLGLELPDRNHTTACGATLLPPFSSWCR